MSKENKEVSPPKPGVKEEEKSSSSSSISSNQEVSSNSAPLWKAKFSSVLVEDLPDHYKKQAEELQKPVNGPSLQWFLDFEANNLGAQMSEESDEEGDEESVQESVDAVGASDKNFMNFMLNRSRFGTCTEDEHSSSSSSSQPTTISMDTGPYSPIPLSQIQGPIGNSLMSLLNGINKINNEEEKPSSGSSSSQKSETKSNKRKLDDPAETEVGKKPKAVGTSSQAMLQVLQNGSAKQEEKESVAASDENDRFQLSAPEQRKFVQLLKTAKNPNFKLVGERLCKFGFDDELELVNCIDDEAAIALGSWLQQGFYVERLYLKNNTFTDVGAGALIDGVKTSDCLMGLELPDHISPAIKTEIEQAIRSRGIELCENMTAGYCRDGVTTILGKVGDLIRRKEEAEQSSTASVVQTSESEKEMTDENPSTTFGFSRSASE